MKQLDQISKVAFGGSFNDVATISNIRKEPTKNDVQELHSILISPHVGLALALLQKVGFFKNVIPEIEKSINLKSSKHFKEIWPHTIQVVSQTPPNLALRWAALFHDLGKVKTFSTKSGKVTFHHHEMVSARIFHSFAKKYKIFTAGSRDEISFLISHLGYVEGYEPSWTDEEGNEWGWTDSAVRRFAKEMGDYLDDILILSKADITTKHASKRNAILKRMDNLKERIKKIQEEDSKKNILPKGLGLEISKQLGVPLGPEIGKIRNILEENINNGILPPKSEFDCYINFIRENELF